jgi:hypothetical protein
MKSNKRQISNELTQSNSPTICGQPRYDLRDAHARQLLGQPCSTTMLLRNRWYQSVLAADMQACSDQLQVTRSVLVTFPRAQV